MSRHGAGIQERVLEIEMAEVGASIVWPPMNMIGVDIYFMPTLLLRQDLRDSGEVLRPFIEDHALDLLDFRNVGVLEQKHPDQRQTHDARPGSQHPRLRISIRLVNGQPRRRPHHIFKLHIKTVIDTNQL